MNLRANGHFKSVLLVGPSPPPYGGMALQARLLEKLLKGDGVPVVFVASNPAFPRWLRAVERVPVVRTVVRSIIVWAQLWKHAASVDIIHILAASWVYFFVLVAPAVLAGCMRRKRVVINYRGGEARDFFRTWGWAAKPFLNAADVVTTPSKFLADVIHDRFGIPVLIVSNILDLSAFRFRERTRFQPKLLVTRHLEKIYDIETVLRAFRAVQHAYPEASLEIVGTGSEETNLRRLVQEWDLRNVRFAGHVTHRDLPSVYDACDILVNASRVDNFPGSLMEAAAAGLVVVSTGAGGIPFMFDDGVNALLVEPGNWEGLAKAVGKVLDSPAVARNLVQNAAVAARRCEWKQVRQALYAAYGYTPAPSAELRVARPVGHSAD